MKTPEINISLNENSFYQSATERSNIIQLVINFKVMQSKLRMRINTILTRWRSTSIKYKWNIQIIDQHIFKEIRHSARAVVMAIQKKNKIFLRSVFD